MSTERETESVFMEQVCCSSQVIILEVGSLVPGQAAANKQEVIVMMREIILKALSEPKQRH